MTVLPRSSMDMRLSVLHRSSANYIRCGCSPYWNSMDYISLLLFSINVLWTILGCERSPYRSSVNYIMLSPFSWRVYGLYYPVTVFHRNFNACSPSMMDHIVCSNKYIYIYIYIYINTIYDNQKQFSILYPYWKFSLLCSENCSQLYDCNIIIIICWFNVGVMRCIGCT
jgi:hypothetical protein